jgi:3-oxoadipate enol-lactonase
MVEVPDGRLHVESAGDGPPVVLIHPGLWDSRTWDDQFGPFAVEHRVIRYDVRGYGRSSRPVPGVPYSHVRDLEAVLDVLEVGRAALVGCSMGGHIALDATLEMPDRFDALVLVASGICGVETTPEEDAWWEERDRAVEAAIEAGDRDAARRAQMEVWAPLGTDDGAGSRILQIALDNAHELTMDESAAVDVEPPAAERLRQVRVPTLVLPADHDPPEMARISGLLAEGIPGARLVQIPRTDHVVNMRQPEAFNRVVLAFLREVR